MYELLETRRVWDAAPHSAFTHLARHAGAFLLAFREGTGHISRDGAARILRSTDGRAWTSLARVALAERDLRDPALATLPDGRLLLIAGCADRPEDDAPTLDGTGTVVSLSSDGQDWSEPREVLAPGRWLWRATWNGKAGFGFAYGASGASGDGHATVVDLMRSNDGVVWNRLVRDALVEGSPNEVALAFEADSHARPGGRAVALARRAGEPNSACIGTSIPPYRDWDWRDTGLYVGGPALVQLDDGRWIVGGRALEEVGPYTALYELDVEAARLREVARLESGGDTSYPGLVQDGDALLVSYYSSHEDKTCIYVARVRVA